MNVIELQNVSVSYQTGNKTIVAAENVSLEIKDGSYLCIAGNNGSGKSSIVKAMLGITGLSAGKVQFNIKKNEISYLSQNNGIPLDFPATVKEIVLCGLQTTSRKLPFYKNSDYKQVEDTMKLLEILDFQNRRFGELSGGQQQRVLLARAIVKNPKVLIMDEPFAGLDYKITQSLYELLKTLNEKMNTTIIMVSHDLCEVEKYATDVAHMDKTLRFCGNKTEWLAFKKVGA